MAAHVATALVKGGVPETEVYASHAHDTLLDLTTDGQLREALGRPRRRWSGFADQAQQHKARWGREYAAFCEEHGISDVVQVMVRPSEPLTPISSLRAAHARLSAQLSDRLRYGRKQFAKGFTCDIIAAEIVAVVPNGNVLDLHFHLAVRASNDELARMGEYFRRAGWSWWDPVSAHTPHSHLKPGALASYMAKGLAHALTRNADIGQGFTDANIAELHRQTHGLAMARSTGGFRDWKAGLERDRLAVVEDGHGRLVVRPRRPVLCTPRFRKKLMASSSAQLLRLCVHDFGDGIKRPAMLVRGRVGVTFAEVAAGYDLATAIASAQVACPVLLRNTSKPQTYLLQRGESSTFVHVRSGPRRVSINCDIERRKLPVHFPVPDAFHRSLKGNFITCN